MVERLFKYAAVYLVSMFKFVVGPTTGIFSGLSIPETALLTVLGMMTSVVLVAFGGPAAREWWFGVFRQDRKLFSPRNRKIVRFWSRFGIQGLSFLTPVIFSPIVGTILAVSFGETRARILRFMLLSSLFWGFVLSVVFGFVHRYIS